MPATMNTVRWTMLRSPSMRSLLSPAPLKRMDLCPLYSSPYPFGAVDGSLRVQKFWLAGTNLKLPSFDHHSETSPFSMVTVSASSASHQYVMPGMDATSSVRPVAPARRSGLTIPTPHNRD